MKLPLLMLPVLALTAGCVLPSSGGSGATRDGASSTMTGGPVRVTVPEGWKRIDAPAKIALAAQGPDPTDQVVVSVYDTAGGAENEAVFISTGIMASGRMCTRLPKVRDGGATAVIDCAFTDSKGDFRKVYAAFEGDGRSALVLVQTKGDSFRSARPRVTPILRSFDWR